MTTRTRVYAIKKYIDPKTGRRRRVLADKHEVPMEALRLAEDALNLRLAYKLLCNVESVDRATLEQLRTLQRKVDHQLREYLAP
jgi:hypothetical protein